jgi:dipeptidyl aminopeptidase/acylaminoacyl peptidase
MTKSTFSLSATFLLLFHVTAFAAEPLAKKLPLPGELFLVGERPAFVMLPPEDKRTKPQPWIMYAPTLPPYPDAAEKWMHEKFLNAGIAVAGIDIGEAYGNPKGREQFTSLYDELIKNRGFASKCCVLGRSRGGLWVTSWAAENTDKVAGLAGIYPVFDFRTYPGIVRAAPSYGLKPEELTARASEFNPIDRVPKLAKAKIPAFIIHGDDDKVVPLKENSVTFAEHYKTAGAEGLVELVVAKGQGHNFWEGFFQCQELVDFSIARAKAGATKE